MPKLAESDAEIIACLPVMSQLRTHLNAGACSKKLFNTFDN